MLQTLFSKPTTRRVQPTVNEFAPIPRGLPVPKHEKNAWCRLDAKGEFAMIPKGELVLDGAYQRIDAVTHSRVVRIARQFSWMAFGTLLVARRPNGDLFVFEGQHRLLAAMKRADIDLLPCLVFVSEGSESEAKAFGKVNNDRGAMRSFDQFRAALHGGDECAIFVNALIASVGRSPIPTLVAHKSVRCLGRVYRAAEHNRERLGRVFPLVARICEGRAFHDRILAGVLCLEGRLNDGASLTEARWTERLIALGHDGLTAAISKGCAYYNGGGEVVWARAIRDALNAKLRTNLLDASFPEN